MKPALVAIALSVPAAAHAERCPTTPDDPVCRPWSAVLLPTAYAGMYAPSDGPMFYGGGVEAVLLAWSDNSQAFGPSQGAFERNASRAYGIPYFAADLGGLWSEATGRRWFVDAGIGVYVIHRRGFVLDVEVTGVLPFQDPDQLGGVTSRLALSFALW
jgi:hypothetical protein